LATSRIPIFFILFIYISPLIFGYLAQDQNFLRPALFDASDSILSLNCLLDFSRTKGASIKFALFSRPFHLAGIEIVIALEYPNLRGELAELGLLRQASTHPTPCRALFEREVTELTEKSLSSPFSSAFAARYSAAPARRRLFAPVKNSLFWLAAWLCLVLNRGHVPAQSAD
jgi:hypothetical protein